MLLDEIKARMFKAMKAGDEVTKEILKVAMGEITTDAARDGRKGDDEEARALLKKLVKSNEETIGRATDAAQIDVLKREIEVLRDFLPKELGEEEVTALLSAVADAIRAAGNDGQATGVAMKHLKSTGVAAEGKVVSAAVKRLRGA